MAQLGLQFLLTAYGFFDVVLPDLVRATLVTHRFYATLLRLQLVRTKSTRRLILLTQGILDRVITPKRPLLQLPAELRLEIWRRVCAQEEDGSVSGILNVLLINKQIHREAWPLVQEIEHRITIGDVVRFKQHSVEYLGRPQVVLSDGVQLEWCLQSLQHLVLEVKVCSIGKMTPDSFDVNIAHNGKEQWRCLKRLIGIWPEIREEPLTSVRLVLDRYEQSQGDKIYRADFIRILRNFKRTIVWAETGDCSRPKNTSVVLPLVRAFNQGRRNWLRESDEEHNLIVRYDRQILSRSSIDGKTRHPIYVEAEINKWSICPVLDTSRSDNSHWPEWTGKEEKYIRDKMIPRARDSDDEWACRQCLAVFDKPKQLRAHWDRGHGRRKKK